jgi:hypothetical protein
MTLELFIKLAPRNTVFPQKPVVAQLVKKLPVFDVCRRFITMFVRGHSLPCLEPVESNPKHHITIR